MNERLVIQMSKKRLIYVISALAGVMIGRYVIGIDFFLAHPEWALPIISGVVIAIVGLLAILYFSQNKR